MPKANTALFKEAERLAEKSRLTEKDIEMLSSKVERAAAKHAKELLEQKKK